MPIAIDEHLLPGDTVATRFAAAHALGVNGVQVHMNAALGERIPDLLDATAAHGLRISAVDLRYTHLLHPEFDVREAAIVRIRRAMSHSLDLNADGVIFRPHYAPHPVMPDLHPYKSAVELEGELLVSHLKATLCDLAYAMGAHLMLAHTDSQDTHLVQRLAHVQAVRRKLKYHPHLHAAADLYHMVREEQDVPGALRQHGEGLRVLILRDAHGGLPGTHTGGLDFAAIAQALHDVQFTGWLTLSAHLDDRPTLDHLRASLDHLRAANLI